MHWRFCNILLPCLGCFAGVDFLTSLIGVCGCCYTFALMQEDLLIMYVIYAAVVCCTRCAEVCGRLCYVSNTTSLANVQSELQAFLGMHEQEPAASDQLALGCSWRALLCL